MSIMQSKANKLYWATQGANATMKRKLFLAAFIEIHNIAVEDSAHECFDASTKEQFKCSGECRCGEEGADRIRRLRIEVPEEVDSGF